MSQSNHKHKEKHGLTGSPKLGLWTSTLGLFAGLTTIVLYGVAGPEFKESLGLSGALLGVLLSSPPSVKPFREDPSVPGSNGGAGRSPLSILLCSTFPVLPALQGRWFLTDPQTLTAVPFPCS